MKYKDLFNSTILSVEFIERMNIVRFATHNSMKSDTILIDLSILEVQKLSDELKSIIDSYGI